MSDYMFRLKLIGNAFRTYVVTNWHGVEIGEITMCKGYVGPKAYAPEYIGQIEEALAEFKTMKIPA